ncbi:extracellular solute-binding protein [Paenibacillus sp. IB182496]|uniref:Extracellular solute-binding protein n=1 Tax=Paenibacillus sabuli TaxID=2772509 RepID=A0A927GTQ1_9BACL|nr:extracellular solute-binding protein [Paenibacillus sabuli]MBD2847531.1 extracellular solute-binding protein [Paenibacillus sabuli]
MKFKLFAPAIRSGLSVILCAALLLVVACSSESGGNGNNATGKNGSDAAATGGNQTETAKEVPTVDFLLGWDPGLPISSELPVFVEWGEKTGVKFNVNSPPRDAFKERMNVVLFSNDLPDMMKFFQDATTFKDYGPQLFVALDEYLEAGKLPNLQRWLDKYPEIEEVMRSPVDGKMYGFPLVQDFDYAPTLWLVRNDLLKKEGLDAKDIKSFDDLKEAMLALQRQTGDYITSSRLGFSYYASRMLPYFGVGQGTLYDSEQGRYVFSPTEHEERYKTWVEFERWMYENKLLHPNFLTMNDQELFASYASGDFPLMREQTGMFELNPQSDPNIEVAAIYPFEVDGVMYQQARDPHYNIGYRGPVVINKNSEHIEDIIRAMDYVYSDEGIEHMMLGVEGVTFTRDAGTPSGYKLDQVQSVWTMKADGSFPDGMKRLQDYGYGTWWLTGVVPAYDRFGLLKYKAGEEAQAKVVPDRVDRLSELGTLRDPDPLLNFTKEEQTLRSEITTALDTYISENVSKFILGQKPMSAWDAFIQGFDALRVDELLELMNGKL